MLPDCKSIINESTAEMKIENKLQQYLSLCNDGIGAGDILIAVPWGCCTNMSPNVIQSLFMTVLCAATNALEG